MDFASLLGLAQEKQSNKVDIKRYSTQVSAPKKLSAKDKKLSENIKKFVQKKDMELREKELSEKQKTKELLAKRSEDKKSTRTMKSMLQRTKSANKAVIADAVDNKNTADTLAGRFQCDEDDYGYESSIANSLYDKLMKQYESTKEDPMAKFSKIMKQPKDIKGTLNRVKSALENGEELPEKRKELTSKRSKDTHYSSTKSDEESGKNNKTMSKKEKEIAARKIRLKNASKAPPPTTNFHDLIKMAEEKSTKSNKSAPSFNPKSAKEYEFNRPMTNKMKEEFKREYLSNLRKAGKLPMIKKSSAEPEHPPPIVDKKGKEKLSASVKSSPPSINNKPSTSSAKVESKDKLKSCPGKSVSSKQHSGNAVSRIQKPEKRDINSVKSRDFPGEKKIVRQSPPRFSSSSFKPGASKNMKRNRIESESEYDSEMDDFIDDSEANVDISAQIRGIFGYDRRKFVDDDDFDDRSMEANYATIMKEEVRSAKIGKMEDLEDIKREEEEKRLKKLAKKQRRN